MSFWPCNQIPPEIPPQFQFTENLPNEVTSVRAKVYSTPAVGTSPPVMIPVCLHCTPRAGRVLLRPVALSSLTHISLWLFNVKTLSFCILRLRIAPCLLISTVHQFITFHTFLTSLTLEWSWDLQPLAVIIVSSFSFFL